MTKSLKTIQTIAKIAKVISNIIFVFSIIGAIACILSVSAMASTQNFEIEGQTIVTLIESSGMNFVTFMFSCVSAIIICIGSAIVSKFAAIYFSNELEDGTPFTYAGAKELLRLGIISIAIPLATSIILSIAFVSTKLFWPSLSEDALTGDSISIGFGLMLIVMSVIFKHGAELEEKLNSNI